MPCIAKIIYGVCVALGVIVWMYIAARAVSRAIMRTIKERRS